MLLPAVATDLERALGFYPPGASVVELEAEGAATLRGVFVPAGEGAPVVLHLLGAAQSPASLAQPVDPATWDLADLGFASLILDYGGVGASGGEPDVAALGEQARRMWAEALRRADGEAERVVVRATSLGTIATALALRAGARPAAVLLVAPVFPDTVVERFARDSYGVLAGWFAALAYRPVAQVDVIGELARSPSPLCVSLFEGDTWATARQREALHRLATSRTPHGWSVAAGDHPGGVIYFASLGDGEREFLAALDRLPRPSTRRGEAALVELGPAPRAALTAEPEALGRFEALTRRHLLVPAEQLAAAALEQSDLDDAGYLARLLRHVAPSGLPFDDLRSLYSTEGSPGEALIATVHAFQLFGGDLLRRGSVRDESQWTNPVLIARNARRTTRAAPELKRRLAARRGGGWVEFTWSPAPLVEATRTDEEYRLTLARAALKAAGIPDRLVHADDGGWRLQCAVGRGWIPLDLSPPETTAGAGEGGRR